MLVGRRSGLFPSQDDPDEPGKWKLNDPRAQGREPASPASGSVAGRLRARPSSLSERNQPLLRLTAPPAALHTSQTGCRRRKAPTTEWFPAEDEESSRRYGAGHRLPVRTAGPDTEKRQPRWFEIANRLRQRSVETDRHKPESALNQR